MQLYPHWLDGEFVKLATESTGPRQDVGETIRAIKLHALFGTQFILNDVQIFDSAAILALFMDDDAQKFLQDDVLFTKACGEPNFLGLRVDPDPTFGDGPFALAARGLLRTRSPAWLSSLFIQDPTPIKQLADEMIDGIQNSQYIDLSRPSDVIRRFPEYAGLLLAVRKAVTFFGTWETAERLRAPQGERATYYSVLKELIDRGSQQVQEEAAQTRAYIDAHIADPEARKARSQVLRALADEPDPAVRKRIWHRTVLAWNYATQKTLQPEGGSAGSLPGATSPAESLDDAIDVLVPLNAKPGGPQWFANEKPAHLALEIDAVSWQDIGRARMETVRSMDKLRAARRKRSADAISEALREHIDALAGVIRPSGKAPLSAYAMEFANTTLATIALSGHPALQAGSITLGAADVLRTLTGHSRTWRRRRRLVNTLSKAAPALLQ